VTDRQCGDCQLCCKLLPVLELSKLANTRCQHQSAGKGCRVYGQREMPASCRLWSCRWLNGDAGDVRRPDRTHYVIDTMPDFVRINSDGVEAARVPVIQVWVDPDFPDAHRDPHLRAYLNEKGKEGYMALVRYNSKRGFVLVPPSMTSDEQWHEQHSNSQAEPQHRFHEIAEVMRGT